MIIDIIEWALVLSNWAFFIAGLVRRMAVPDTRLRYICATIQWATFAPALLAPILPTIFSVYLFTKIAWVFNFAMALWAFHDLRRDDDDNWFRRKRKQLKRYFASIRVRRLQPAMGGAR